MGVEIKQFLLKAPSPFAPFKLNMGAEGVGRPRARWLEKRYDAVATLPPAMIYNSFVRRKKLCLLRLKTQYVRTAICGARLTPKGNVPLAVNGRMNPHSSTARFARAKNDSISTEWNW